MQALELSKDAKDRLAELKELSAQAEGGDKAARAELRKAVRESSSPEIVPEVSDIARRGQWGLIKTAAAGDCSSRRRFGGGGPGRQVELDASRARRTEPDPTRSFANRARGFVLDSPRTAHLGPVNQS